MVYANAIDYDDSIKPKDINWITDDIEAKMAPFKPNDKFLSDREVDTSVAEAAFVTIFAPKPGELLFGSTNIKLNR